MAVSFPVKYLSVLMAALLATFLCFWLMQILISSELTRAEDVEPVRFNTSHFSPFREIEKREARRKPQRAMPSEPPPTPDGLPNLSPTRILTESQLPNRASLADILDAAKFQLTVSPPLQDLATLVVVQPVYPFVAMLKEIEGYVLVQFTVRTNGTVTHALVLESEPGSTFDDSALSAIRKFRFRPREIGGDPIAVAGMQLRFAFTLTSAYAP
jgi:protein TonB